MHKGDPSRGVCIIYISEIPINLLPYTLYPEIVTLNDEFHRKSIILRMLNLPNQEIINGHQLHFQ